MHIKRFEASTMREAVSLVKQELGPDALILSTRATRRDGGLLGLFGRSLVEVTAAVDRELRRAAPRPGEAAPRAAAAGGAPAIEPDPSWRELRLTRALVHPLEEEVRELRRALAALARTSSLQGELLRELRDVRRLAGRFAGVEAAAPEPGDSPELAQRLLESGLAPQHAHSLSREAAALRAAWHALDGEVDPELAAEDERRALLRVLCDRLETRVEAPRDDGRGRVALLVGATGVGKTTTLAKLAAREARAAEEVAVLSTDSFRVGAEDQLRSYAELLGVPFGLALSPQDLAQRVGRLGARRVFVDTAGRAPGDAAAFEELLRVRELLGPRGSVHLVVSATTKSEDLLAQLDHYRPLAPDSLIVTKVDESDRLGNVANLVLDGAAPPLAWVGTGQRVPEDLGVPDPSAFATRIVAATA